MGCYHFHLIYCSQVVSSSNIPQSVSENKSLDCGGMFKNVTSIPMDITHHEWSGMVENMPRRLDYVIQNGGKHVGHL